MAMPHAAGTHMVGYQIGKFVSEVNKGEARWSDLLPPKETRVVTRKVRDRDMAVAHFALRELARDDRFIPLLRAARPYAHAMRNAGEPGVAIDAHLIGTLLTDALTGSTAK